MKVAISQSNYIPWLGYFDLISKVDCFVLYDSVQYTKRDWRNRNLIKTSSGLKWITIPVQVKGKFYQRICDTKIADNMWAQKHWLIIKQSYCKAPYFKEMADWIAPLYLNCKLTYLSDINYHFISEINQFLGIQTLLNKSSNYDYEGNKNEKLIQICKQLNATEYISGPAAKSYLDNEEFFRNGISVSIKSYENYKEYPQQFPPFIQNVSIIDLLFNLGIKSKNYFNDGNIRSKSSL